MSAQRLSTLFPFRNFYYVANILFKCLARHVCLEFLFDNNKFMKMFGVGFFIYFFSDVLELVFTFRKNFSFPQYLFFREQAKSIVYLHTP